MWKGVFTPDAGPGTIIDDLRCPTTSNRFDV
jgi:hypothetical protein